MEMRNGIVTEIGKNGWAAVALNRAESCHECGESHCCGSLGSSQTMVIKALNQIKARQGDLVQLDYSPGAALKGAAIYYILMMAGLVLGAVSGAGLGEGIHLGGENAAILFSVLGSLLGLVFAGLLHKRKPTRLSHAPQIHRVIRRGGSVESGQTENGHLIPTGKASRKCTCAV
ncbi:MAG: SoxR reducing system RseC family protein [Deltaproteobacteria bacterium]|nr:SoxR reducing system RseC family protein [Deltaproteobacteria bacterium]